MDRLVKVTLIVTLWVLTINALFGFTPSGLGSWSAGIDLQRYTIQQTVHLGPMFLDSTQATWFQQASGDPVYGLFFGFYTVLGGTKTEPQSLEYLHLLPPSLFLYAGVALVLARMFARSAAQDRRRVVSLLSPILFLVPYGRLHVFMLGYNGGALAPAIVLLLLWLLLRELSSQRRNTRLTAILLVMTFVLMNTYHTWATYFAILASVIAMWVSLRRGLFQAVRGFYTRVLAMVPIFWLASALYTSDVALYARFVDAVTVLRTTSSLERPIGFYFSNSAGPLQPYLRVESLLVPGHLSALVALALFSVLLGISALLLKRHLNNVTDGPFAEFGLGLVAGSAAVVPALVALGGFDLAISRGFEFLSTTGPLIIMCAFACIRMEQTVRPSSSIHAGAPRRKAMRARWLVLTFVAFVAANVVAASFDLSLHPHDELLSDSEAQAVASLSGIIKETTLIWSDDRIAAAFLYHGPKAFTAFDLSYDQENDARALISVFYGADCHMAAYYLNGTGARIGVLTSYMTDQGIVQRTAPLVPAPRLATCFNESASRIFSNGEIAAYDLKMMYWINGYGN